MLGPYYTRKQNFEVLKFRTFITYWLLGYECSIFLSTLGIIIQRNKTLNFRSFEVPNLSMSMQAVSFRDERAMETEESTISTVTVTTSPLYMNCSSCIISTCWCCSCAPNWDAIVRVPTQFWLHILDHISFIIHLIFKNEIDPRSQK
jgi:hypothetical protein